MNTFKFLNSFPIETDTFAANVSALRSKLYSHGICWTDSAQGNFKPETPFRVVLYTKRDNVDFKNPMAKECNGLIFEYNDGWNLLAMPQYGFCTNKISMRKLVDLHSAGYYDVYEVLDATILTLYHYNGKWVMSSTKGYDVGDTEMIKGMTFMEALKDLMDTKYKAFTFDMLNEDYSYTIALRHSKYHIFDETKHLANRTKNIPKPGVDMNSYIMIMSVAEPAVFKYVSKNVPGLPTQNPITMRENSVSQLLNYSRSAYAKYAKAYHLNNFKYKPLYGYILRSKNRAVPDEYSTIYIESELFKIVKYGLYKNNEYIRNCDYNKLVVQMSSNHERYGQFKIMFQQFKDKFDSLTKALEEVSYIVTERIVAQSNGQSIANDKKTSSDKIIDELAAHFKNEPDVTAGIIKDALYSKQFVNQLSLLLD